MSTNKKILYITYDGMTDPLGQSQVLPYLCGLAKEGYQFTILSFEKKDRYEKYQSVIKKITEDAGIVWEPMTFTTRPPVLAKYYDWIRMKRKTLSLHQKNNYDMLHCRSYIAASLGLILKHKYGVKFLFDMRGFWADEKKDAGTWNQQHFLFRKIYQHYKKKEALFVKEADAIISLTNAGKAEMMKWPSYNTRVPLHVIPCCADMRHFSLTSNEAKLEGRKVLGLPAEGLIISYLGSVGAWYMVDEMLQLFAIAKKKYAGARLLFVTHSSPQLILNRLSEFGILENEVLITEANRTQVPVYMKASDITLSFIKPVYSKLSSSPTKLGEVLAMGIPVITNSGVGDVAEIIKSTNGGYVIDAFDKTSLQSAVDQIPALLKLSPDYMRERAIEIYSLDKGIHLYSTCYKNIFSTK
jgi:glycosyltransferase involved in cell wall biosynthesis